MNEKDKEILDAFKAEKARDEERAAIAAAVYGFSRNTMPKIMNIARALNRKEITDAEGDARLEQVIQEMDEDHLRYVGEREEGEKKE